MLTILNEWTEGAEFTEWKTDAFMNQAPTAGHPIIVNSNTIELTVHTFCYLGLRLTLC